MNSRYFGIYRGVVTHTRDPEDCLRIKVRIPAVLGEQECLAAACVPPGTTSPPEVGTQIWIAFEGGDPSRPVWIGVAVVPGDGAD